MLPRGVGVALFGSVYARFALVLLLLMLLLMLPLAADSPSDESSSGLNAWPPPDPAAGLRLLATGSVVVRRRVGTAALPSNSSGSPPGPRK
jgi:hypothetical protein